MSFLRRILIAVVGLLLLLNVGALALVRFGGAPRPSKEKSKVVIWIDNKEEAESALEKLEEMDYKPLLKPAQRSTFVDANYRLVMSASRRELLEPVARVLKKAGHQNLTFNDDGTILYYGGYYASKAEAKAKSKALQEKEMLVFEVEPGKKEVKKPSHRLILMEVPDNMISSLVAPLEDDDSINVANTEETSLEPANEEDEFEDEDEDEDEDEE